MTTAMAPDSPVEHLHVRRHNLSLVLRLVAAQAHRSRASIAATTGLTRATVSSLVAELIRRGLVRDLGRETDQRVGRPATLLELDGSGVVTVGVELNVGYTSVIANDLAGTTVYERRRPLATASSEFETLLPLLVGEIRRAIDAAESAGHSVAGIGVAVPGIVDAVTGVVVFAPNFGWRHVPLGDRLGHVLRLSPCPWPGGARSVQHGAGGSSQALSPAGSPGAASQPRCARTPAEIVMIPGG